MSPTNFGWLFEEISQSRSPVTVPRGIGLVLEDIYNPSNVSMILRDHVEQSAVYTIRHSLAAQCIVKFRY